MASREREKEFEYPCCWLSLSKVIQREGRTGDDFKGDFKFYTGVCLCVYILRNCILHKHKLLNLFRNLLNTKLYL